MKKVLDYLYRYTILSVFLYRRTVAYRLLFPNGEFLDAETVYPEKIELILRAIKQPAIQLEERDMGFVLSQLIQSDISYDNAYEICRLLNVKYENELHYMNRRNFVEQQLDELLQETLKKDGEENR